MIIHADGKRIIGKRDFMIFGHFIEHFHRQIYGGVYDPESPFADEDGFRTDVLEAMRRIRVPILRWPGGCFVSSYHWRDGVGEERTPSFDKAWRVEDPNTFGTDEYIRLCRKIGCEPYICTNAGTGTAEEMSDWVEYCNLESEGKNARERIRNGHQEPYGVVYWSIGNENYGAWEIGAKTSEEWGCLTREAAKMMKHVDPDTELTAAALPDVDWNIQLLKSCGQFLDWISIHEYWDPIHQTNALANYGVCMSYTADLEKSVRKVRGLLCAMDLEKKIRIAFDEWNLRGWYHPNVHTIRQGRTKEEYLYPRDDNDRNSSYTMADAVFSACFLNMCLRNCDIVGMANFAPVVNTRGCIYTYDKGIVLRSTYYVFDMYTNLLGDVVLDAWTQDGEKGTFPGRDGTAVEVPLTDVVVTAFSDRKGLAVAAVNKSCSEEQTLTLDFDVDGDVVIYTLNGSSVDSYNDVDRTEVSVTERNAGAYRRGMELSLEPHSVNIICIR